MRSYAAALQEGARGITTPRPRDVSVHRLVTSPTHTEAEASRHQAWRRMLLEDGALPPLTRTQARGFFRALAAEGDPSSWWVFALDRDGAPSKLVQSAHTFEGVCAIVRTLDAHVRWCAFCPVQHWRVTEVRPDTLHVSTVARLNGLVEDAIAQHATTNATSTAASQPAPEDDAWEELEL